MILIRADANPHIGSGHVMRCLSIAGALAARGEKVLFVTADHSADAMISSKGFESACLESQWDDWKAGEGDDLISKYQPEMVLIDSYYVTESYLDHLKGTVHTTYMDDLNAAHWNVDYLINYNIFAKVFDYSSYNNTDTQLLLMPGYAPLREEFRNLPKHKIGEKAEHVMVSAGGADPLGITGKIIEQICPHMRDTKFHFVVGSLNPRIEEIRRQAAENDNVILHINEKNMSALMKDSDLAVSAAGSTLYELCACGTPTVTYTLADNQLAAAEIFEREGLMLSAGDCREDGEFVDRLAGLISQLSADRRKRESLSGAMQQLVDGYGADRIAERLMDGITKGAL